TQHPALAVEVQAVAGLDFQRGRAVGEQGAGARQGLRQQRVLACRADVAHGGDDAAAGAGDFLVAGALQALLELARAVAGEHQVGMAVDQPGGDQATAQVDDRAGEAVGIGGQAGAGAGVHDRPVAPAQRAVPDQAVAAVRVEGGQGGAEDQPVPGGAFGFAHVSDSTGGLRARVAGRGRLRMAAGAGDNGGMNNLATRTAAGWRLPAIPNLHSHAFQRAMAGMAERRTNPADSFWTWRETMYRFAGRMTPDTMRAVAAQLYVEMLEAGYGSVCEFQYVHHQPDGTAYGDPAAMSQALVE